jgi:Flp pilus assembly protein TadD
MTNRTFSILLASAAIFGASMAGCSGANMERRPLALGEREGAAAARIERLLGEKDYAKALQVAETLVGAQPQDGDARALLGRAYLANGRYVSARTAFGDAMALGNRDPRTIISLSLCETALGDAGAAHELLAAHIQDIPAADYGLAMAMTGDAQEAVRALLEAAKQPDATAKTRQNLAYALAMGGAWAQARLVAGQDLSAREAEKRMGQWAWSLLEGKQTDRVVAMVGIAPRADDEGLPTALALNQAPVEEAQAMDLASAPEPAAEASEEVATDDAPPVEAAPVPLPDLPGQATPPAPRAEIATAAFAPPSARPSPSPDSLDAAMRAAFGSRAVAIGPNRGNWAQGIARPASDAEASDWVVQLGAFDSAAIASDKWRRITARRSELGAFKPVNSVFAHDGRNYHRLAIRGFGDRGLADLTCLTLKSLGQDCFVRLDDTDATRMARSGARKADPLARKAQPAEKGKQLSLAAR